MTFVATCMSSFGVQGRAAGAGFEQTDREESKGWFEPARASSTARSDDPSRRICKIIVLETGCHSWAMCYRAVHSCCCCRNSYRPHSPVCSMHGACTPWPMKCPAPAAKLPSAAQGLGPASAAGHDLPLVLLPRTPQAVSVGLCCSRVRGPVSQRLRRWRTRQSLGRTCACTDCPDAPCSAPDSSSVRLALARSGCLRLQGSHAAAGHSCRLGRHS